MHGQLCLPAAGSEYTPRHGDSGGCTSVPLAPDVELPPPEYSGATSSHAALLLSACTEVVSHDHSLLQAMVRTAAVTTSISDLNNTA